MSETVTARFEVLGVERVRQAGRLLALANVTLDMGGVELVLQGVRVFRCLDGDLAVSGPQWRHPGSGKWTPGVMLPDDLARAMGREVIAAYVNRWGAA